MLSETETKKRKRSKNSVVVKELKGKIRRLQASINEPQKEDKLSRFEKFLNIVRGKVDIKYRLRLLLEPDNLKTTTRLSRSQIDFVSLSHFVADKFPEEGFEPLKEYADLFCECNISHEGKGRTEAIQYEGAITESKLFQKLGIFKTEESKPVKGKA